jgi:hypothetical protein
MRGTNELVSRQRGSEAGEEEKDQVNSSALHRYGNGWNNALCSALVVWLRTDNAEDKRICPCREDKTRPTRCQRKEE